MSVDEQQLQQALTTYGEGIEMTTSDVDRMQRDLHDRLGRGRRPRRSRIIVAAAAVFLLVAGVVGGTVWLRRAPTTAPAVPSGPSGWGTQDGLWFLSASRVRRASRVSRRMPWLPSEQRGRRATFPVLSRWSTR